MSRQSLPLMAALLALSLLAYAVLPDEIQVDSGDINAPGAFGLGRHVNTTPSGIGTPSHPGEVTTPHTAGAIRRSSPTA